MPDFIKRTFGDFDAFEKKEECPEIKDDTESQRYYEEYQKLDEFVDETEARIGKENFDILKPGFWEALAKADLDISTEKGGISHRDFFGKYDKNLKGAAVGSTEYFRRVVALDIFYDLIRKGLLKNDDKPLFIVAVSRFCVATDERMKINKAVQSTLRVQMAALAKLNKRDDIGNINEAIKKRLLVHLIVYALGAVKSPEAKETYGSWIREHEGDITPILGAAQQSADEYGRVARRDLDRKTLNWGHEYSEAFMDGHFDTDSLIGKLKEFEVTAG